MFLCNVIHDSNHSISRPCHVSSVSPSVTVRSRLQSCFDRLRRHPDSKSTLPYGVTSRPGVPKRRSSNSAVEEIILLEESDVFGHDRHRVRAASPDPLWEPSDDDRSGSSDGSYDESDIQSLMNDAKKLYAGKSWAVGGWRFVWRCVLVFLGV